MSAVCTGMHIDHKQKSTPPRKSYNLRGGFFNAFPCRVRGVPTRTLSLRLEEKT